jgi:hypothetical protein
MVSMMDLLLKGARLEIYLPDRPQMPSFMPLGIDSEMLLTADAELELFSDVSKRSKIYDRDLVETHS